MIYIRPFIALLLLAMSTMLYAAEDTLRVRERLDSLTSLPMFQTSQMALMAFDLRADTIIYAINHKQMMRPASTMKLLTTITALDILPSNYRFHTSLHASGHRDSTSLCGDLFLYGTMDPSLSDYDIDCLAEGVIAMQIDTIRGSLITDRSFKDTNMYGAGWCWDDKNPTLSPLVYHRNDDLATALRERLASHGITIMGADSLGRVADNAVLISETYTPLMPIIVKMMKDSDNLYAESVYYHLGHTEGTPSTAKLAQTAERKVINRALAERPYADSLSHTTPYRLADGSGLSLYNYLTAETEVLLLRYAYHNSHIYESLLTALPIAGVDGSLKKRMKNTPCYNRVQAKTGSVTGAYSLAGYCGHIAFCIINQGIMSAKEARDFQDSVCAVLCDIP